MQPQTVVRGGNTSNSTLMPIPLVNVPINNISSTNNSMPVGIVPSYNHGSTTTSYTFIPTRLCTLPNMGFPYGGAHQSQNIQGINMNPLVN